MIEVLCDACGFHGSNDLIVEVRTQNAGGRIHTLQMPEWPCPRCGTSAKVLKYDWRDYYGPYYDIKELNINKRAAKRIIRKIGSTKDIEALPASIEAIEPRLKKHIDDAISKKEPDKWLKRIALIVGLVAGVTATVHQVLGSAYTYELLREMELDKIQQENRGEETENNNHGKGQNGSDKGAKNKSFTQEI